MNLKKKERNSFVELLRIVCIFGILFMHKNGFLISEATGIAIPWILLVNVFNFESSLLMLISSYYGNPYSSRKRLIKLWLMVMFYSYSRLIIELIQNGTSLAYMDAARLFKNLFPITTGFSWFASGYMVVWLIAPYTELIIENVSKRDFQILLLIVGALFSVFPTFLTYYGMISDSGKDVGSLFLFYLVGRYLRKYNVMESKGTAFWLKLGGISIILQLALNGFLVFAIKEVLGKTIVLMPFTRDLSALEIILSISILGISTKIVFSNKVINFIGRHSFGILLSENIVFIPLTIANAYNELKFGSTMIGVILAYVFIIMVEGLIVDVLRSAVFKRFEDAVALKVSDVLNRVLDVMAN